MKELIEEYGEAALYLLVGGAFCGVMLWMAQQLGSM